jgi:tRNA pseudouridine13 synthase
MLAPPRSGEPLSSAAVTIKRAPQHFQVRELPAHAPGGEGGHLWLELERTGMNTEHLVRLLARLTGLAAREVGHAGLKDRHAVSRQWFSVPWRGAWQALADDLAAHGVTVLDAAANPRKLRRGALKGNRFRILVEGVQAPPSRVHDAVARLRGRGVPHYFGPQRFGHGGANLERARDMLTGAQRVRDRHRRGLYLSAARSALFNRVLAARVRAGTWDRLLAGEAVALAGTASFFAIDAPDEELRARLHAFDLHPSGPLWGRGEPPSTSQALQVELDALCDCEDLMHGLARAGLEQARRPLRVAVPDLDARPAEDGGWWFGFSLPAGAYATVVLRELFDLHDASAPG